MAFLQAEFAGGARAYGLANSVPLMRRYTLQNAQQDPTLYPSSVLLEFKTRFWEHLEHPIIGGCGSVTRACP